MHVIKDVGQFELIHGGEKCDYLYATECQLLFGGLAALPTTLFFVINPSTAWSAIFYDTFAGFGLGYLIYRTFGRFMLPQCEYSEDIATKCF